MNRSDINLTDYEIKKMNELGISTLQLMAMNLKERIPYKTALWNKENKIIKVEHKHLISRKPYIKEIPAITDRVANQMFEMYNLKNYKRMLSDYIECNSTRKGGAFIFEYENNVDEQGYIDAKLMLGVANSAYDVYSQKLDTPSFDKTVSTLNRFFKRTFSIENVDVYGVIVGRVITAFGKISDVNKDMLINFQEKIDKTLLEANKPSENTIEDDLEL